jgi:hypothetical protein
LKNIDRSTRSANRNVIAPRHGGSQATTFVTASIGNHRGDHAYWARGDDLTPPEGINKLAAGDAGISHPDLDEVLPKRLRTASVGGEHLLRAWRLSEKCVARKAGGSRCRIVSSVTIAVSAAITII